MKPQPTASILRDWSATFRPSPPRSRPRKTRHRRADVPERYDQPRGRPLTHGNIAAELDGINEVLKFSATEKILSLLPLFHAYLQIVNLWVATTYGCEVGYLKKLTPAELSEAMKTFKPTILTTVPPLVHFSPKKIFDAVETNQPWSASVSCDAFDQRLSEE